MEKILEMTREKLDIVKISMCFRSLSTGVRQRDPLSPLLFCLAEDVLSSEVFQVFSGSMKFISSPRGCIPPSHVLYADDIMIFCKADVRSLKNLATFLDSLGQASSQVVSKDKSRHRSPSVSWAQFIWLANIPPKISILEWKIFNKYCLPTNDVLQHRGVSLASFCTLCSSARYQKSDRVDIAFNFGVDLVNKFPFDESLFEIRYSSKISPGGNWDESSVVENLRADCRTRVRLHCYLELRHAYI
ncbi:hypothetical protein Q3G72_003072 [Acer saccharum]|nr:hypothetical protein Q3G72_003072 [Acer saccharum]